MPRKPKHKRPAPGRYTQAAVAAEIQSAIARRGERGTHARLAEFMGLESSQQLTHRLAGDYELTVEESGLAADFFDAPLGWPFIPWAIAERLAVKH